MVQEYSLWETSTLTSLQYPHGTVASNFIISPYSFPSPYSFGSEEAFDFFFIFLYHNRSILVINFKDCIQEDGYNISDPKEIAETFNGFFRTFISKGT